MKKTFTMVALIFSLIKILAQSYEENYLFNENARLEKVRLTEIDIHNFINQNLNTFDFTDVVSSVDKTNGETGELLSGTMYENSLNAFKIQKLRDVYFKQNPEKIVFYYAQVLQNCINGGFEDNGGSIAGYTFKSQDYTNSSWNTNYNNFPIGGGMVGPNEYVTLMNSSSTDPYFQSISPVNNGNYAIRLNKPGNLLRAVSSLRRDFIVNQNFISFKYALFFQNYRDGGHFKNGVWDNRYPYYIVRLKNANDVVVFQKIIVADQSNLEFAFSPSNNMLITGWKCESINTTQFMGQYLKLEIAISNCGNGGHFGYGYFDDFCGLDNSCTPQSYATINLNPQKETHCPSLPMNVSGNFYVPPSGTFNSLELDVLDTVGNVITTLPTTAANLNGNYFNFYVDYNHFYPLGVTSTILFNFRARLKYTLNGIQQTITANNTNPPGPDVSFRGCTAPCFEELDIINPVSVSHNYQASSVIYASSIIQPNLLVDYRAGNEVQLLPGFYVTGQYKGIFHAYIGRCEGNDSSFGKYSTQSLIKKDNAFENYSDVVIYPNPASTFFKINTGKEKLISWELYDMSGKLILKGNSKEVDIQNVLRGNYLLKVNLEQKAILKTIIFK